jgi:beta-glucosidase
VLPLDADALKSIAVIGGRADLGVLSGGGSARVDPVGGNATGASTLTATDKLAFWRTRVWIPSSPLKAIQERAPDAQISYDDGSDFSRAARVAATSQLVILFVTQYATEGTDLPNLHLPDDQDELVRRVTAANPNTVVVMETGGAVLTPWADSVRAILEVWYPGQRGGDAVANLLFGMANPSGKLPLTFPRTESDLPRSTAFGYRVTEMGLNEKVRSVTASYAEGGNVGYRWFQSTGRSPAFAFGYGLSYTRFRYAKLALSKAKDVSASFDLTNTGSREGAEIAQVYVLIPGNGQAAGLRLAGWSKVRLKPGETRRVTITVEPKMLMIWDVARKGWVRQAGAYGILVGSSSADVIVRDEVELSALGVRAP